MSEFVILFHQTPESAERADHWDLMIQSGDSLMTWALESSPLAGRVMTAVRLADHRLEYLDYQGPLSDDRGVVSRLARGTSRRLDKGGDVQVFQLATADFNWRVTVTEGKSGQVSIGIESWPGDQSSEPGRPV
ncbi:MAG: hypothetical protein MK108_09960 [Mariniblastus sp.]|nr:hypothetical protein [Mariniblastus sp.]